MQSTDRAWGVPGVELVCGTTSGTVGPTCYDSIVDYNETKKGFLRLFVAFLGLTALIAVVSVLSEEFGKLQEKILLTSLTISVASVCSMSCAAFIDKKKAVTLGLGGIGFCTASAALVIFGVWTETIAEGFWKTTSTVIVLAVALAHAFLLVLPELEEKQRWVQPVSAISIGVLALQIIAAIVVEIDNETYYRLLAAVAIIVGLETLVVPILMKLRKENSATGEALALTRVDGDVYRNRSGREFRVTPLENDPSHPR